MSIKNSIGGIYMRLLLAEDEKALSKALTAILERNHYSVDAVYDGKRHWHIYKAILMMRLY